ASQLQQRSNSPHSVTDTEVTSGRRGLTSVPKHLSVKPSKSSCFPLRRVSPQRPQVGEIDYSVHFLAEIQRFVHPVRQRRRCHVGRTAAVSYGGFILYGKKRFENLDFRVKIR
ncbi:hypothetical protein K0M31_010751, partial [Melipona bicolor]